MTAHWYRFGPCPCPAQTIMDVRFVSKSKDFSPLCPVAICPDCGFEIRFSASWQTQEEDK